MSESFLKSDGFYPASSKDCL